MIKERIDDLVDAIAEEYGTIENTFAIKNSQQLANYLDNPDTWLQNQIEHRQAYAKLIGREAGQKLRDLNKKTEKVFLLSYREVDKDKIEIKGNQIIAHDIPKEVREKIKELKKFNAEQITALANQALITYNRQVQLVTTLSTPETFYNVIKKQMVQGVKNGIKVAYKDGRQMSWRSYMEMNSRTTIHQEIAKEQVDAGAKIGQIFYMCDSFADCADDHADYQGKMYYNAQANIPQDIAMFIQRNGIKSMQEVMNDKPWLTTRPNCRHNFHAIPLDEALGNSEKELLDKYKLSTGKYKGSNYEAMQQQRYNERMIRKYKLQKDSVQQLNKTMKGTDQKPISGYDMKIKEWQARQRKLIKSSGGVLKRDYERENINIIKDDVGVHYDYSWKELQNKDTQ